MTEYVIYYFVIVNIVSFFAMGADKLKAKKHSRRTPEATLFTLAVIGGSVGAIAGMYIFRHKTKHTSFVAGMPAILAAQLIAVYLIIRFL